MTNTLSISELRKMQKSDLIKEIASKRIEVTKLKHGLDSGAEKNSHIFRNAKKVLAVMLTVLSDLYREIPVNVPSKT